VPNGFLQNLALLVPITSWNSIRESRKFSSNPA